MQILNIAFMSPPLTRANGGNGLSAKLA
jgi:hypothetical protein